jgi:DNA-binding IclR family transcriptional regulator
LAQARAEGYATVVDELSPGENGLAAPIIIDGHIIGCLDLCGPSFRFTPELMRHWAPTLKSACARVENLLRG